MKRYGVLFLLSAAASVAGVFDSGHKNIALSVGAGTGFGNRYTIVGISGNYFAVDGLSVGVGYRGWFGGTPTLSEVDLPVTYYFPLGERARPYGGVFYRHTFISDGYDEYETYGARAGFSLVRGNSHLSVGWVQEWYSYDNGEENSRGYPEIAAGFSF